MVTAYALTLAGLLLFSGALGDRYGRKRVFLTGVVWFAVASLICGVAPDAPVLIAARAVQGIGAALLTPGSLAILEASFRPDDRSKAIGAWSGFSGVGTAIGPFLGGWLIAAVSWRLIFIINLPVAVLVVVVGLRHVPESRDQAQSGRLDVAGGVLVTLGPDRADLRADRRPRGRLGLGRTRCPRWSAACCCSARSSPGSAARPRRCCRSACSPRSSSARRTW